MTIPPDAKVNTELKITVEVPADRADAFVAAFQELVNQHGGHGETAKIVRHFVTDELMRLFNDRRLAGLLIGLRIYGLDDLRARTEDWLLDQPGIEWATILTIKRRLAVEAPSRALSGENPADFPQSIEALTLPVSAYRDLRIAGVRTIANIRAMECIHALRLQSTTRTAVQERGLSFAPTNLQRPLEDFGFKPDQLELMELAGIRTAAQLVGLTRARLKAKLTNGDPERDEHHRVTQALPQIVQIMLNHGHRLAGG